MRTILTIALKDLSISLQNREQILLMFAMPIILMLVIGSAINIEEARVHIDVINHDSQGALAGQLIAQLADTGGERIVVCQYGADNPDSCELGADADPDNVLNERLEDGETAGALIIPADFTTRLQAGEVPRLEYRSNDRLNAPSVASQAIDAALSRVSSAVVVAQTGVTVLNESLETDLGPDAFGTLYQEAETAWRAGPPVNVRSQSTGQTDDISSGVDQSVPGVATMFVLISMLGGASVLVIERHSGTLQRLYTLPVPRHQVVIGKMMSPILFGLVQYAVLIGVGMLIGVNWGNNWLAIALICLAFVLCGGALGFALATVVRTEAQASGIATFMALTLAPLGGAWWPLEIVPDFMVIIGHISPIAWAMDAFHDLTFYNGGLVDVLPEVGILLLLALAFTAFGVWNFEYE